MRNALLISTLVLASCQAYDFEQVSPIFYRRITVPYTLSASRADVMILIDRSGSMKFPIDATASGCPTNCGTMGGCPASCETRISDLKKAMPVFLTSARTDARFGLTLFPAKTAGSLDDQCTPSSSDSLVVPLPPEGADTAENIASWGPHTDTISSYISNTLDTGGGTPTAQSLDFVATTEGFASKTEQNRKRVVLLLTDGLPNCRPGSPQQTDTTASDSVAALQAKGIGTMVIGFGADVKNSAGANILNAMAIAGGYRRDCKPRKNVARTCGADDTCDADQNCGRAAYSASNAAELEQVLEDLHGLIDPTVNPCVIKLGSVQYSSVFVNFNDKKLAEGATWARTTGNTITFTGSTCEAILASTVSAPINIDIGVW